MYEWTVEKERKSDEMSPASPTRKRYQTDGDMESQSDNKQKVID